MNARPDDLLDALGVGPEELERLQQRLSATAEKDGLLDVGYRSIDTPVGRLLVAATPLGLVKIAFPLEDPDVVLQTLATRISPRLLPASNRLDAVARELDEYFSGRRRTFDLPLDLQLTRGFRRQVVQHLTTIGYGHTESYTEVARAAGSPRAVRAVGSACATNPLPVVIPCHRVLRSDGSLTGYAGGPENKRLLLDLERRH